MPGVLVVAGVQPCHLERALTEDFRLPDWFWNQRSRSVYVRLGLRVAKLSENNEEWLADRDFCVSLVEVLDETPLYPSVDRKSPPSKMVSLVHAVWAGSASLPNQFQHGCVFSLDDVSGSLSPELACHVNTTMCEFRDSLVRHHR